MNSLFLKGKSREKRIEIEKEPEVAPHIKREGHDDLKYAQYLQYLFSTQYDTHVFYLFIYIYIPI
jgi:hypothetical protein